MHLQLIAIFGNPANLVEVAEIDFGVNPLREQVQTALSVVLRAPVTISATTTDGLGYLGNTEGVAVVASALIQRAKK